MSQLIKIKTIKIAPKPMTYDSSMGSRDAGVHASTMTLYSHNGWTIEWDVPTLDECVHIGLETSVEVVDGMPRPTIVGYDGVFSFPEEAIELCEGAGFAWGDYMADYVLELKGVTQ